MAHTLDAALAGADATNADGATTVKTYLDVVASTTVSTARINQTSFVTPLIQLAVDTTSGTWANNAPGMDVWIGSAAGLNDIGIYRLRDSQASYILIGEVGSGDAGLVTPGIRNTAFADNQYVTIVNRYSPWSVLPLISAGVIYEDYGVLVSDGPANFNSHPPPLVSVKCTSTNRVEWNHISCFVDDGQTYGTVTFLAASTLWPTSASATYAWTAPGSWTVTAGATNTATFTAQIPNSATNYVLDLAVTENGGNISKRHVMVWVHTRTGSNVPLTISGLSGDGWDRTGAKLNFALNDALLANLPDGAMVNIWQEATFKGATIATAVDQFTGWIVRINKLTEPGLRTAEPEFVGPAGILDFKRGTSQIFDVTAGTPSTWQQLPASLMSLSFAQFWFLSQRARGILELFDFIPYSTDPTGQRMSQITIPPGNIWTQLVSLADGISKRNIGCDPDGTIWVQPHPSLIDYSSRSAIVKRDTLTAARYHDVDWPREMFDKTSLVEGEGFIWDGVTVLPTPILSIAPGFSMGQGGGDNKIQGQYLTDQTALNVLTGNYYRLLNPDYPELTFNLNGNRGALYKPAQMQMVRGQIPQNLTPENVAFDRYFVPREVRRSYLGNGAVSSSVVGEVETSGVAGATKPVPAANNNLYADVTVYTPPVTSVSGGESALGLYGGVQKLAAFNADGFLYITTYFPASAPTWTRTDLGLGAIIGFVVDAYSPRYLNTGTAVNGWLTTDGTSAIYRVTDIFGSVSTSLQKSLGGSVATSPRGRTIDASFGVQGYVVVVSYYKDLASFNGLWETHTINSGATWSTEVQIDAHYSTGPSTLPSLFVSPRNAGTALTSAYTVTSTTPAAKFYSLTSNFGTSTVVSTPAGYESVKYMSPCIHVPYHDNASELIVYFGGNDGTNDFVKRKNADNTITDISPDVAGVFQRPSTSHAIHTCPIDRQSVLLCGTDDVTQAGVWVSRDAGDTFSLLTTPGDSGITNGAIAGNSRDIFYVWGVGGIIGYSSDFTNIADKRGNIAAMSPAPGNFINICGG